MSKRKTRKSAKRKAQKTKKARKTYNAKPRKIALNERIFQLPPYKIEEMLVAASETRGWDWGLSLLNIPSLWRLTQGRDIKVAILDTGMDFTHPDLVGSWIDKADFTGSPYRETDKKGHGTHAAGIIAARQDHRGVVGIAPQAKLLIAKVLDDDGYATIKSVVDGIKWAIKKDADIISTSFGSQNSIPEIYDAVKEAVDAGIFVIASSGNDSFKHVDYPAAHDEVVAVGAINKDRTRADFSSYTPGRIEVDIVAPGNNIYSTYPTGAYRKLSGTSMAAPFVTGVVALMLAKHRDYGGHTPITNYKQLLKHLRKTATDLGPNRRQPDEFYGYGLINPVGVVTS